VVGFMKLKWYDGITENTREEETEKDCREEDVV
jgi:hypothetical protein